VVFAGREGVNADRGEIDAGCEGVDTGCEVVNAGRDEIDTGFDGVDAGCEGVDVCGLCGNEGDG